MKHPVVLIIFALAACSKEAPVPEKVQGICEGTNPWQNVTTVESITKVSVPLTAQAPGYGSSLAYDASDDTFWGATDRGANTVDWKLNLVQFKLTETSAEILNVVPITKDGTHLSGVDLDPEDIVFSPIDGTIWVADESKPSLVQLSREGVMLQRIDPPAKYLERVTNQGFEGVAISCDGKTVWTILQSGLSTEASKRNTWLVAYNLDTKEFKDYPYLLDDPAQFTYPTGFTAKIGANALVNIGGSTLLVSERDNGAENSKLKRVYKIEVPETPSSTPLAKTLLVDTLANGYPFVQQEGLAVKGVGSAELYISNDNDGEQTNPGAIWIIKFQ